MTPDMQRTLVATLLVIALLAIAIVLLGVGVCTHNLAIVMSGVSTIIGGLLTALTTPSGTALNHGGATPLPQQPETKP